MSGGGLPSPGAGHEGHVGDGRLVLALADRRGQQLVGDDEVEEGLVRVALGVEGRPGASAIPYKRVAASWRHANP